MYRNLRDFNFIFILLNVCKKKKIPRYPLLCKTYLGMLNYAVVSSSGWIFFFRQIEWNTQKQIRHGLEKKIKLGHRYWDIKDRQIVQPFFDLKVSSFTSTRFVPLS